MSLEKSRYASRKPKVNSKVKKQKPKDVNPWKEVKISESNLIVALEYVLRQTTHLKPSETIERVIVGEPDHGSYPLSVAIIKGKEV